MKTGIGKVASDEGKADHTPEHGHAPGQHGGIMVSLGRDSYHIEAVIDSSGAIRLYTLGKDESRVIDVDATTWKDCSFGHCGRKGSERK